MSSRSSTRSRPQARARREPDHANAAIFDHVTFRRAFGVLALLAMTHLILAGTASACVAARASAASAESTHSDCAPGSSHEKGGSTDRTTSLACCTALVSCANAALTARTVSIASASPATAIEVAITERAPRADAPAPELPPPRA